MKSNESTLEHYPASIKRFKSKKKKTTVSDYKVEIEHIPSAPLSEEETNILLSIMCNNENVTYIPRATKQTKFTGTPLRWEYLGFSSNEHYINFCHFNGLKYDDSQDLAEALYNKIFGDTYHA